MVIKNKFKCSHKNKIIHKTLDMGVHPNKDKWTFYFHVYNKYPYISNIIYQCNATEERLIIIRDLLEMLNKKW